jgi:CheY-like chemotaxis protein
MKAAGGPEVSPAGHMVLGSLDPALGYARISVSDSGPGIDRSILRHIFDPFFTTKGRGRGTGLGLAVVQGIIAGYGGACVVMSDPGAGTRFDIYLPLSSAVPAADAAEVAQPKPRGRGRLLVVDDEPLMAEMLSTGLERLGYEVVGLTDPRDVLEAVAEDPDAWDAVISDQIMPHMKGTALFARLKEIRPSIRFVLLTGYDSELTGDEALASGIAAVFMKPVAPQEIVGTLSQLAMKDAATERTAHTA